MTDFKDEIKQVNKVNESDEDARNYHGERVFLYGFFAILICFIVGLFIGLC